MGETASPTSVDVFTSLHVHIQQMADVSATRRSQNTPTECLRGDLLAAIQHITSMLMHGSKIGVHT